MGKVKTMSEIVAESNGNYNQVDFDPSETKPKKRKDKRVLTMFIVIIFSFLVALVSFMVSNPIHKIIVYTCLIFVQAVILKNILDDYYDNI